MNKSSKINQKNQWQPRKRLSLVFFIGMKPLLLLCLLQPFLYKLHAQGSIVPTNNRNEEIINRLEIKTGISSGIPLTLRPYNRKDIASYALKLDTLAENLTDRDREDLNYIFRDNNEFLAPQYYNNSALGKKNTANRSKYPVLDSKNSKYYFEREKPLFKYFYKTPANLFEATDTFFYLKVNPIINFQVSKDVSPFENKTIFNNLRGLEIRGGIDDRVYFYTNILEAQARFPEYVNDYVTKYKAVPGAGLFKKYRSTVLNITDGYDFANSQAVLGFNVTPHIGVQLGHGRNFIGNGYRSVLLSDFATNYFYLQLNWRVKRFQLQNIFAELASIGVRDEPGTELIPKKYSATHYLSYMLSDKIQVGFFESVVFTRDNGFELQYLNPVIFYRTVEAYVGSPDNVLLGVDARWNFGKGYQLYSQFVLDEFKFNELFQSNEGWWGNKYALQVGIKAVDFIGIESLDLQAEYNMARPYTYTSRDSLLASYTHFKQSLAHPLGANFNEGILIGKYRPFKNLFMEGRFIYVFNYGEDFDGLNWGSNPLLNYNTRVSEYGNEIGQGVNSNILIFGLDLSYQIFHNGFIDLTYYHRRKDSIDDTKDQSISYLGGGLRINIGKTRQDF